MSGLRPKPMQVDESEVPPNSVRRVGPWAVGKVGDEAFAVSRRCRHQLADLSEGSIDSKGCLVCPWHGSRYDVRTGRMVAGPKGFLAYRGPTPGYSSLVLAYGRYLKLQVGRVARRAGKLFVD